MQWLWTLCALFTAALIELALGRYGWSVPVFCMTAFHFFVFRHWLSSLFTAWFLGVFLDAAFARPIPEHLVLVVSALVIARCWRGCQLTYMMVLQVIPGLLLGGVVSLIQRGAALVFYGSVHGADVLAFVLDILKGTVVGGVMLPLVLFVLDRLSWKLGLLRYTRIGGEGLSAAQAVEIEEWGDDIS